MATGHAGNSTNHSRCPKPQYARAGAGRGLVIVQRRRNARLSAQHQTPKRHRNGHAPEHCEQAFLNDPRNNKGGKHPADFLVFAQCGATIAELNQELEPRGLALITSGASNGQTICGAISTGTHGAAWKFGAIHDFILGFQLIGHQGESYWIEPASRPVMAKSFCEILGATLVRDDQLFYAALVSFGSFGVIHAVILRAEPLYLLEQHVVPRHFDAVMAALPDLNNIAVKLDLGDAFGQIPHAPLHHFEIVLNPFALKPTSNGPRESFDGMGTYIRYMYKRSPPDLQKFSPNQELIGLKSKTTSTSNEAFSILQRLDMLTPFWSGSGLAAQISKLIIDEFLLPDDPHTHLGTVLTPGGTFAATGLPGRGLSCELGIAGTDLFKAIDIIVREFHEFPLACMPSLHSSAAQKLCWRRLFRPLHLHDGISRFPLTAYIDRLSSPLAGTAK